MIEKIAKQAFDFGRVEIEALNMPVGWEIFEGPQEFSLSSLIKTASLEKDEDADLNGFDLTAAIKQNPDHLFVKVFAIKKDEVNDNGDAFNEAELKKAAETFIGVPVFCNHANDDIEKARGKVVHAWFDDERGGIFIISMVDKVAYPKLARGIQEGYITGTSMGCQVHHSLCSICHNKAHVADEYCSHIKERKTKKFSGKAKCAYHKSKCKPGDECPVCSSAKGDEKEHQHKEAVIHEWNFGLKFIEDSFVVNPACHDCLVSSILNVPEFNKKVAALRRSFDTIISKAASSDGLVKTAGQKEVEYLNKAMKYMEVVAKSMIDQKDQVSLEYVSDLMEVFAKLQSSTDELVEMGYAAIQSPTSLENPDVVGDAAPAGQQQAQQTTPQQMPQPAQQPTGAATSPAQGGIGSVTKPSFSPKASGNLKDLQKQGAKFKSNISALGETIAKMRTGNEVEYHLTRNNTTVMFFKGPDGGLFVSAFTDGKLVKAGRDIELEELYAKSPDEAALIFMRQIETEHNQVKESDNTMSNPTEKTAAGSALKPDNTQVTTEKQLNDSAGNLEFAGRRQYKDIDGVTESDAQLGQSKEPVNDTTSTSPQVRQGDYADVTHEGQLADLTGTAIARWNSAPDVILEKQWDEFNRLVGAELKLDQKENVTETMLKDLRDHHRWTEPDVTTENQLGSSDNWLSTDNAWLNKSAASAYAKHIVTASIEALSDAIAIYKRTPQEITKAAKFITRDPHSQIKAAFLVLVNGMPSKIASRKAEQARINYFDKVAGVVLPYERQDVLLACMGDHCRNIKAEDFVDAIRHVASDPVKMAKVEELAKKKMAQVSEPENDGPIDRFAAMDEAFKSLNTKVAATEDDGLYEVRASLEDIGVATSDSEKFISAAENHARSLVKVADAVLYSVEVDNESGTVVTILKSASKLTNEEQVALEKAASRKQSRDNTVKQAQMMGGQMGGGMGGGDPAGGGAGATMPAPPAGGAPGAPPTPPVESLDAAGDGEAPEDEGGGKPKPPGSICPLCGTQDVDVVAGKWQCKNPECGHKGTVEINLKVLEGPMVGGGEKGEGEEEGGALGDEGSEGEGFPMPEGGDPAAGAGGPGGPGIPVAATTKLDAKTLKKLASQGKDFGRVSPYTGSTNTFKVASGSYLCLDTGHSYKVEERIGLKNVNEVYARWTFNSTPKFAGAECTSCNRARSAWTKALKSAGISDEQFDEMSFKKKADTILVLASKGHFNIVKTASKNVSVLSEFQSQYKIAGTFPTDACRQKLANRYGENAVALSGPCKGEKIYDCVCSELKKASIYSDRIALKLAESWKDKDACLECMEDYVRIGFDMEKAATVCQHMKLKYAGDEEFLGEEMTDSHDDGGEDKGGEHKHPEKKSEPEDTNDPFNDGDFGGGKDDGSDFGGDKPTDDMGGNDAEPEVGGDLDENGDVGGDMPGGMGGDMGGDIAVEIGGPAGAGGAKPHGSVTIELPLQALDAIEKAIDTAHGENPGDEAHHDIPPGMGDQEVSVDLPGDVANPLENAAETALDGAVGGEDPLGGNPDGGMDIQIEGDPSGAVDGGNGDASTELSGDVDPFGGDVNEENKPVMGTPQADAPQGEGMNPNMTDDMHHLASYMRKGRTGRVGEVNLDVTQILAAINKKANESEPTHENAQDAEVGTYQAGDGSTQGNEKKFDADKPKVPRNNATIGEEPSDLNPNDKPLPKIPSGGGSMGHEEEAGYTAEKPTFTGGLGGAGKTETASGKGNQKVAEQKKIAGEKQIAKKEPVSEEIKGEVDYSDNKDLKSTPDKMKRTPFEESDHKEVNNIPEKGEGAFIGDEKSSIGEIPKDQRPSIPVGGGRNPKYDKNEKYAPEKQEKIKGTVIAKDEKSKAVQAEAVRIAGRMIEAKLIDAAQLMEKIAELGQYQLPQLADIEKALFKAAQKGLATAQDGVEQPVPIINEASNNGGQSYAEQLRSMFKLDQQNRIASELTDANLRKSHGR